MARCQQLHRRGPRPVEPRLGSRDVDVDFPAIAPPAEIAVKITEIGGLQIAPTALVQAGRRNIGGYIVALDAVLQISLIVREGAAEQIELINLVAEAASFAPPRRRRGR